MTQIAIEMPERDSYGEIMKGYFSLMRGFGVELGMRCDALISESDGTKWWDELVAQRRAEQESRWKGSVNRYDPGLVLPEYAWRLDSPIAKALSSKPEARIVAKKIQAARNSWVHFTVAPGPAELQEVATLVKQFASLNGMQIAVMAARMVKRLDRIRTGQYQPFKDIIDRWRAENPVAPGDAHPNETAEKPPAGQTDQPGISQRTFEPVDSEGIELDAPTVERRPAIGARWSGEIPSTRFVPSATGDLVDPSSGDGLRSRVGSDQWGRKRGLWLAPRPLGGVWVDGRDGAVGGFVDNVPRLLGYVGDEPDDGLARGFLTSHYYEVADARIVDLDSGLALLDAIPEDRRLEVTRLEAVVLASAPERASLRLSTYGDLVALTEDGAQRVAVIEPEQWFPGHLA
jgi:hypothetical protein